MLSMIYKTFHRRYFTFLRPAFYNFAAKSSTSRGTQYISSSQAIKFTTSAFTLSIDAWAYRLSVILISECPMIYCKLFGFIFLLASRVQNVCRNTCGVILGSLSSCLCCISAQYGATLPDSGVQDMVRRFH